MKTLKQLLSASILTALCLSSTFASAEPLTSPTPSASPDAKSTEGVTEIAQATPDVVENSDSSEDIVTEETEDNTPSPLPSPTAVPADKYISDTLDFHIVMAYRKYVRDSFIKLEVYDKDNNLVGTEREWVGGVTKAVDLHFDVPDYRLGDTFTVKLVEGAETLSYYDSKIKPGESFNITTNYYNNSKGEFVAGNKFNFNAVPNWEKEVVVYVEGEQLTLKPRARIVNDRTLIPVRQVAEAMGIDIFYNPKYDSVVCSVGDDEIIFNLGTKYATFFGKDLYLDVAPCYIQNSTYIPARYLAEAFDASIKSEDYGDHIDVIIGESKKVRDYMAKNPVNKWNISSRTNYMVWVSKSEYKVRLYQGSKNKWKLIHTAPCAIGAPGTPTVTGSFEYIERTQWDYGTYYVGPVLRFYNGYALHSTLLYYGGGEYDGRVGVQISHGCVRMHPSDINLIANTIPFRTRIYITE